MKAITEAESEIIYTSLEKFYAAEIESFLAHTFLEYDAPDRRQVMEISKVAFMAGVVSGFARPFKKESDQPESM